MTQALTNLILPYNSISIIGMCKNAGKTTVLNKLLTDCRKLGITMGITSIGRDGEEVDIVTGTDKPKIFVSKGTIIATAAGLLKKSDITIEILRTTQINTPLGEIVFVRARSDGYVQIGGSSIGSQIVSLLEDFKELGADKVLIDGAISRKTLGSPIISDAVILSTGASLGADMNKVVRETAFVAKLLTLEPLQEEHVRKLIGGLDEHTQKFSAIMADNTVRPVDLENSAGIADGAAYIYVRGALSDGLLNKLIMSNVNLRGVKIVVDDGSKLFITERTYEKVRLKGSQIIVLRPINLLAVTINPISTMGYIFDKDTFKAALSEQLEVPVYNAADEKGALHNVFER